MKETTVYRTWDEPMACMAVDLLQGMGLHARMVAEMSRSIYPMTMDGLGEIWIVVPEDEVEQALEILEVRFSEKGTIEGYSEDEFGREDFGDEEAEKT
ncbi:MAG: DUF2007 domain-containing protein [Candidatus Latescibacter sp.]|nr:DUF2007 domain-containing protein [Candidatus Latescibacter sp.]